MSRVDPRDQLADAAVALVSRGSLPAALADFAQTVAVALDVDAVSIVVLDASGTPALLCASPGPGLGLVDDDSGEGPFTECLLRGAVVTAAGPELVSRWPRVGALARAAGFEMLTAVPMTWQGGTIGVLSLLRRVSGTLTPRQTHVATAFAAVATLALGRGGADLLSGTVVSELHERVVVDQAKGVLAHRGGLAMAAAEGELHDRARTSGQSLPEAARSVIDEAQHRD